MIDPPEIVQTTPQLMAYVHLTVPREQIRQVMNPAMNEVLGVLVDQGIEPSGPWFTHHLVMDPEVFDFQVCFPVETPVKPVGRVQSGEWPAMTVARTIYKGSYAGLGNAWQEFGEWMGANGYQAAEDLFERYVSGPPRELRTELSRPLA